jgi:ABC-type phosphate/phosphonate transport system ATPase subunit
LGHTLFDGRPDEIDDRRFKEIYGQEAERIGG